MHRAVSNYCIQNGVTKCLIVLKSIQPIIMKVNTSIYRVEENKQLKLSALKTNPEDYLDKEEAAEYLAKLKQKMFELQEKLYAENMKSVLIIFQAMDAAGKDSVIKHVMRGLNPQGCQVFSFKQPSSEELDHDFLWRYYKALPERGRIGIHNRSHYENVLVCKVHPVFAANESRLPPEAINEKFWKRRYDSIRNFEEHLLASQTVVLKFFLNVSKKEQKERLLERLDKPAKNWKFSAGDLDERDLWEDYMDAYQRALNETSTSPSPWYIIPADKKWFARLIVCQVIVDALESLGLQYPQLNDEEIALLEASRKKLAEEE